MCGPAQNLTVQAAEANSIAEYSPFDSIFADIPKGTTKFA